MRTGRVRTFAWIALVSLPLLGVLAILPSTHRAVALPVLVTLGLFVLATVNGSGRTNAIPLGEVGYWHMTAVAVYTTLPLITFMALNFEYTPFNDNRLFMRQPEPALVAQIAWYHVLYFVVFVIVYTLLRNRWVKSGVPAPETTWSREMACVIGLLLILTMVWQPLLLSLYGLRSTSYADTYAVLQTLPRLVGQLNKVMVGARVVLGLAVLLWLFHNYQRRRWLLFAWVVAEAVSTVVIAGGRTPLMVLIAGSVMLYHLKVRRMSLARAAIIGSFCLLLFTALGYYRAFREAQVGGGFAFNVGEFDAIFGNAVDLLERRAQGELNDLPPGFAVLDLLTIVPTQMLPSGSKTTPADWYLDSFYPEAKEAGLGLAFGVIPQAIVGAGSIEIVVRAALWGCLCALLLQLYCKHRHRPWVTVCYVWAGLFNYQAFRASTFNLAPNVVHQILPTILVVSAGAFLLRHATAPRLATGPVPAGAES